MKKFTVMMSVMAVAVAAATASAANQGSSPKGKPFIELNGQIIEVEGAVTSLSERLDLLVATVDTLEGQVIANQAGIDSLQQTSASLQYQIDTNADSVSAVLVEIDTLQLENASMYADLVALGGQDDYLEGLILTNEDNILSLQTSLQGEVVSILGQIADLNSAQSQLQSDMTALDADVLNLQDQIDANASAIADLELALESIRSDLQGQLDQNALMISALESEITMIEAELEMKQNTINGVCPDGTAATEVLADGTLICGAIGGGGAATPGELQSYQAIAISGVGAMNTRQVTVNCDDSLGYRATGGGYFVTATAMEVYFSAPVMAAVNGSSQSVGWKINAYNNTAVNGRTAWVWAVCTRVTP